jgi:hypothetical protein
MVICIYLHIVLSGGPEKMEYIIDERWRGVER